MKWLFPMKKYYTLHYEVGSGEVNMRKMIGVLKIMKLKRKIGMVKRLRQTG
jgi:hypothetical protein